MFKTEIITDPLMILTKVCYEMIEKSIITYNHKGMKRNCDLLTMMQNDEIHWSIECDGGEYHIGIEWDGHGDGFEILKMCDIVFCLRTLALGCGINEDEWERNCLNEISITKIFNPFGKDHNRLYAGFWLNI